MKISTEQLFARLSSLQRVFSYKIKSKIDTARLPELAKNAYTSIKFRPRLDFVLRDYADIASAISSGHLTLHAVDMYYLGEFVKTTKFPKMSKISNEFKFKEAYKFYSAANVKSQIEEIQQKSAQLNTALSKFTKQNKSVFEQSDAQTNELYQMMIDGKISLFVYAYFLKQGKFTIDFSKVKDMTVYRNLKIAEYVSNFEINEVLVL